MGRRTRNRARLANEARVPVERSLANRQTAPASTTPDDEMRRPLWPFLSAFGLVAVILAYILFTGSRGDSGPTNAQKIRTLTEQYVAAYNADDQARMKQLSCPGLAADESPLHGEPKGVAIARMRSESPQPGVASADVKLTIGGKDKDTTWWYVPDGANWVVCRKSLPTQ